MATKSDICNAALSHIGISQFVANIDQELTKEARVCKKWWSMALEFAIRDRDWNFSRRYIDLAQLDSNPPSHWKYKYQYPGTCFMIRAIMPPGIRNPTIKQRVQYEVSGEEDANGNDIKVIYTDQPNAAMRFSKLIIDPSLFDSSFVIAQGYLLASFIAMPLTIKPAIASAMRDAYNSLANQAYASNNKEAEEGPEPEDLGLIRDGVDQEDLLVRR